MFGHIDTTLSTASARSPARLDQRHSRLRQVTGVHDGRLGRHSPVHHAIVGPGPRQVHRRNGRKVGLDEVSQRPLLANEGHRRHDDVMPPHRQVGYDAVPVVGYPGALQVSPRAQLAAQLPFKSVHFALVVDEVVESEILLRADGDRRRPFRALQVGDDKQRHEQDPCGHGHDSLDSEIKPLAANAPYLRGEAGRSQITAAPV